LKNIRAQKRSDVLGAVAVTAAVAAMVYTVVRAVLFSTAQYTLLERGIGFLLLFAELFVVVHGIGYAISVFQIFRQKDQEETLAPLPEQKKNESKAGPFVAVIVPARNEPKDVLETTFITIKNMTYENKVVYFLDDSTIDSFKREAEELAKEYGLVLFRRTKPWHGAKAGVVNDCLETIQEEFVAVFDADQNPMPKFLSAVVTVLKTDERLAFVQTPQFYSNIENCPVARASNLQQSVFYEYICEGKSLTGSMFCCGTNVVFRTKALKEVGGFDETTVTEDFSTSVSLHARGWKSLYYNHVGVFGVGPETLRAYFLQQFRWASGTITVFKRLLSLFIKNPRMLSFTQWVEYFLSSTYYFVGMAFFVLMLCPIVYLTIGIPSFFANPAVYFFAFLPYLVLTTHVFYGALKKRHYRVKDLFLGQWLSVLACTVFMRASLAALIGVKISFGVTPKGKESAMPLIRLWPQMTLWLANFIAIVWGMNRYYYEMEPAIAVNSFWALYHFLLLSGIFYFNRDV